MVFLVMNTAIIVAQPVTTVQYNLQIRGDKYEDKRIENYVPLSKSFTYIDSSELSVLASDYLNAVFASDGKFASIDLTRGQIFPETFAIYSLITKDEQKPAFTKFSVEDTVMIDDGLALITKSGMVGLRFDTVYIEDPATGESMMQPVVSNDADIKNDLAGFSFYETWEYKKEINEFVKTTLVSNPFVMYYRGDYYDYGEGDMMKRKIDVYSKKEGKNPGALLKSNMIYDVKVIPEWYIEEGAKYDYSYGLPGSSFISNTVIDILTALKDGKIKAYLINEATGEPDISKPLNYSAATDSISYIVRKIASLDTAKLRRTGNYKLEPVIEKKIIYQMNELGEYVYDDNYNPVIISESYEIVGADTLWPSPEIIKREIAEIKQDTITVYKADPETGEYSFDEDGNMVVESRNVVTDTIWNEVIIGLNDFGFYKNDTVWFNKPSDICSFRFYEDWYIDRETFRIFKKVKGIAFVTGRIMYNREEENNELLTRCKVYFSLTGK